MRIILRQLLCINRYILSVVQVRCELCMLTSLIPMVVVLLYSYIPVHIPDLFRKECGVTLSQK